MELALLALSFLTFLSLSYRLYGGWIARQFELDDRRPTPAQTRRDDVDFVPTPRAYLFAQHFSAIAAAGPIAGPILACQAFGWGPCLVWIALGVVLIGSVHDFSTLTASVRAGGSSIAEIARSLLGARSGWAIRLFIWLALLYVIVAFADITAGTFVAGSSELQEVGVGFHPGGAVALSSVLYLFLALLLGWIQKTFQPPLWLVTLLFVPATFAVCWVGTLYSELLLFSRTTWAMLILSYCVVASVMPVWSLLQPRGYLGGYVLYVALFCGVIGLLFGGYSIEQPFFRTFDAGGLTGALFPFLFVTIACGACSGFHGLVCSGTTSKQVACESDCQPIGYGAMLCEAFVALIALATIMIVPSDAVRGLSPGTIYGNGIGRFLTLLLGEEHLRFAVTFGAMAFSTFVFDTLDVAMRLGRYLLQELLQWEGRKGAWFATLLTALLPGYLLLAGEGSSWVAFWTLFGASNQLLAALTLLVLFVWLRKMGRKGRFALLPMLFVFGITMWALSKLAVGNLMEARGFDTSFWNGLVAITLMGLAIFLGLSGWRAVRHRASTLRESSKARYAGS
jgi:carbon starvation protein